MKLGLLAIGDVPEGLLPRLSDRLTQFGVSGAILNPMPIPGQVRKASSGPLKAETFVRLAAKDGGAVLAVTGADLCAEGYDFVFGYANIASPGAVVSIARLRDPAPSRFLDRVVKEAVHELGHTWGLPHCESPACVMHHSESLEDADAKGEGFCRKCGGRVLFGIGRP